MEKFKNIIGRILQIFVSREFAFLFVLSGVAAQVAHTFYLTYHVSSFEGWTKIIQAIMLSTFISVSLLYFVSVSDDGKDKKARNTRMAVNLFMAIEILINLYYYSRYLILNNIDTKITIHNWFDFAFGILIAFMIPITIKLYGSHIEAHKWIAEIEKNKKRKQNIEEITDIEEKVDNMIKNSFEENSKLFLENYKNKLKLLNNESGKSTSNVNREVSS